jgi:hypothetical protein
MRTADTTVLRRSDATVRDELTRFNPGNGDFNQATLLSSLLFGKCQAGDDGAMSACASNPGGNKNVNPAGGSTSHNVPVTLVVQ